MSITLLAVSTVAHTLTKLAIETTLKNIDVDEVLVVSDKNFLGQGRFELIDKITTREQYSKKIIKDIANYIETDHVLVVQYDGMAVNKLNWNNDFLKYDYIGAPWYWHNSNQVGNGGFSLRSKKLIDLVAQDKFILVPELGEDENICRHHRENLEQHGIRFAPIKIASMFSHEREAGYRNTFGFHGIFNVPFFCDYQTTLLYIENLPNRLLPDQLEIIPYAFAAGHYDLVAHAIDLGRKQHENFDEIFIKHLASIPSRFEYFLENVL